MEFHSASIVGLVVSVPLVDRWTGGHRPEFVAPENPQRGQRAFVVSAPPVDPTTGKQVSANSLFIFSSQDGTITGWNPGVGGTNATPSPPTDHPAGATYTGPGHRQQRRTCHSYTPRMTDRNRRIDVFDSNFKLANLGPNAFVDPKIPQKFAPLRHSDHYRCARSANDLGHLHGLSTKRRAVL